MSSIRDRLMSRNDEGIRRITRKHAIKSAERIRRLTCLPPRAVGEESDPLFLLCDEDLAPTPTGTHLGLSFAQIKPFSFILAMDSPRKILKELISAYQDALEIYPIAWRPSSKTLVGVVFELKGILFVFFNQEPPSGSSLRFSYGEDSNWYVQSLTDFLAAFGMIKTTL